MSLIFEALKGGGTGRTSTAATTEPRLAPQAAPTAQPVAVPHSVAVSAANHDPRWGGLAVAAAIGMAIAGGGAWLYQSGRDAQPYRSSAQVASTPAAAAPASVAAVAPAAVAPVPAPLPAAVVSPAPVVAAAPAPSPVVAAVKAVPVMRVAIAPPARAPERAPVRAAPKEPAPSSVDIQVAATPAAAAPAAKPAPAAKAAAPAATASAPAAKASSPAAAAEPEPKPAPRPPINTQVQLTAEAQPFDVRDAFQNFVRLVQQGQLPEAQQSADQITKAMGPKHVVSLRAQGYLALKKNELDQARSQYLQLQQTLPEDREAGLNLALIDWRQGDRESAAKRVARLIDKFPNDPEIRSLHQNVRNP